MIWIGCGECFKDRAYDIADQNPVLKFMYTGLGKEEILFSETAKL